MKIKGSGKISVAPETLEVCRKIDRAKKGGKFKLSSLFTAGGSVLSWPFSHYSYVPGLENINADLLSRFQIEEFLHLNPQADESPTFLHQSAWILDGQTWK